MWTGAGIPAKKTNTFRLVAQVGKDVAQGTPLSVTLRTFQTSLSDEPYCGQREQTYQVGD